MAAKLSIDWSSIIERGVETEELDYKAPQNWHDLTRENKSKFARHCMAMANTKGGYIVVGVGEDRAGRPRRYTGLTEKQSKSFDPTDVGNFINRFSDPAIDFDIERPVFDGKRYAVFVIRRFSELPHVCSGSCGSELQQGVFYIRTADASSRPAYRSSEIHAVVQRALRNQRELLGRMLRGILYEGRQTLAPDAQDHFSEQLRHSEDLFRRRFAENGSNAPILEIAVSPPSFEQEKFSLSEIRRAVESSLYTFLDTPFLLTAGDSLENSFFTNVSLRYIPEGSRRCWQVFQSGFFHYMTQFELKGQGISYSELVKFVTEAVHFLGQFYSELGYDNTLLTLNFRLSEVEACSLSELPPSGSRAEKSADYVCRIPEIMVKLHRTVSDLASGPVGHSSRVVKEICERFNLPESKHQALDKTITWFLEKKQWQNSTKKDQKSGGTKSKGQ
ncbi:MAG: hypothetical protein A2X49_04765 [Lentisphaerae bacterium GWF2_52_8]|nr:MAG: hypothetical protein A2X49_04765 [Lentisphaerae bacterium GWF2_52_8]